MIYYIYLEPIIGSNNILYIIFELEPKFGSNKIKYNIFYLKFFIKILFYSINLNIYEKIINKLENNKKNIDI